MKASYGFLVRFAKELVRLIPSMAGVSVMRQWAGLYDMTEDGTPIIQEVFEIQRLILPCGWSEHGFMLAPIIGTLLAEQILSEKTSISTDPFRLNRFQHGDLLIEKTVVG